MTNPVSLIELAEHAEKATGPDRELDLAIAVALGWSPVPNPTFAGGLVGRWYLSDGPMSDMYGPPRFTASLDAAMTLVPEGWHIASMGEGPDEHPRSRNYAYDGTWFVELHSQRPGLLHNLQYGGAATPALALTAAALRAQRG